jgi:hypothetical protein
VGKIAFQPVSWLGKPCSKHPDFVRWPKSVGGHKLNC